MKQSLTGNNIEVERSDELSTGQQALEMLPVALHWLDSKGTIIWANKRQLDLLGYVRDEFIHRPITDFLPEPESHSELLELLALKKDFNFEAFVTAKNGSSKPLQLIAKPYIKNGILQYYSIVSIDAPTSQTSFNAVKISEIKYRKLIETLHTPLYTTDAEGRLTFYNQAAALLWGRHPELGKDMWCGAYKILDTDGRLLPADQCPMAICLKQKKPVFGQEVLIGRPDDTFRNVVPYPQPMFNDHGDLIGGVNMLVDVTNMKMTEQALRDSETKYRELVNTLKKKVDEKTVDLKIRNEELKKSEERYHKMIDEVEDYAIILLDRNGIIQNWNKGAEKIKGYKESEIVGQSFSLFYGSEDRNNMLPQKLLQEAALRGKAIHEGWRLMKDGRRFWGSIVLTALHDDQNNLIGFSKVTRDLTERKLSEDRLREYTYQLEFQNKELEQFAYAASHDMKEPLRKIHIYNSSIADNQANKLDERSKEYLNRSLNAVRRMSTLIEDLLTYSKTTPNEDNFEKVDLNRIIEEIAQMHKEELEQNKVSIHVSDLPLVNVIAFQIKQLFSNLISNSIKYKHPERNLILKISQANVKGFEIENADAEPQGFYHKISITDNGIGFDPIYAEKIFNIFQRLDNLPQAKGSGIGLAICKRIVQNHHGFITASGNAGEGAQFDIYLPVTKF